MYCIAARWILHASSQRTVFAQSRGAKLEVAKKLGAQGTDDHGHELLVRMLHDWHVLTYTTGMAATRIRTLTQWAQFLKANGLEEEFESVGSVDVSYTVLGRNGVIATWHGIHRVRGGPDSFLFEFASNELGNPSPPLKPLSQWTASERGELRTRVLNELRQCKCSSIVADAKVFPISVEEAPKPKTPLQGMEF